MWRPLKSFPFSSPTRGSFPHETIHMTEGEKKNQLYFLFFAISRRFFFGDATKGKTFGRSRQRRVMERWKRDRPQVESINDALNLGHRQWCDSDEWNVAGERRICINSQYGDYKESKDFLRRKLGRAKDDIRWLSGDGCWRRPILDADSAYYTLMQLADSAFIAIYSMKIAKCKRPKSNADFSPIYSPSSMKSMLRSGVFTLIAHSCTFYTH